eukprot:TRINITY_DN20557_c0_g1_i1.p1 TRINITY_DN20557_c0_g1~~TRINITY_DN20557_c0_g1_i1.p1  ORF type:complete len:112 (-),score=16.83 TRINITY_DN20557_c0_g1_i1:45-380(-)
MDLFFPLLLLSSALLSRRFNWKKTRKKEEKNQKLLKQSLPSLQRKCICKSGEIITNINQLSSNAHFSDQIIVYFCFVQCPHFPALPSDVNCEFCPFFTLVCFLTFEWKQGS